MSERHPASNTTASGKAHHSLSRSLLLWFLLLALLPLTLTAWLGYREAVDGMKDAVTQKLEQGSQLKVQFIQNWFDDSITDLNSQAENQHNAEFLAVLQNGLKANGKSLAEFIKSYAWTSLVDGREQNLVTFSRRYDYIHDLFLIDSNGNILYSVARESDLGTNLFDGPSAGTLFARSVKTSLSTGQTLFSDLERYAPSNDLLVGFVTAPLLDKLGNKVGAIAIQIQLERINDLMQDQNPETSLTHYLVGEDGLLRTMHNGAQTADVLFKRVDTRQFKLWQHEHGHQGDHGKQNHNGEHEVLFDYQNPGGQQVIGIHQTVRLPGTYWVLISEIEEDEALMAAQRLGQIIFAMILLTATLVAGLSIYLARRITRPIIQLADASMAVAAGEVDQQVVVNAKNEIGLLAEAFNYMLEMRHKDELALKQSSKETKKALKHLADLQFALDQHAIVAITDTKGAISFANDKLSEISGYSHEELMGQHHHLLTSDYHDKAFLRNIYRTLEGGDIWHGEICNKAKDGHLFWVDSTIVPFRDEDGQIESYVGIRTDITDMKRAEIELIEAKEAAESATQQKSDFLANMSHEIRTPMNGIIGMTGLLMDTPLTAQQQSYVDATMRSTDALLNIINDILDFSKIEAGKLGLEEVPFDLQNLAEDVAELMSLKCQEKELEMLLRYKPGSERFVVGDPGRIRQILLNLLSNAIKFTEQGHILLTVESIAAIAETVMFRVTVQDTGIGIAADKLEYIFSKFDQEDSSTTRKYGGTGLGLSICQQLCHMMHGEIQVESQKGKGSTFIFTMQLDISKQLPPEYTSLQKYEQLKGVKTLIVDDTDMARTILMEQLSTLEMRLASVASGEAAIKAMQRAIAENDPFDIVITDYQMQEIDGEALAKKISELDLLPNGAMVFVTSSPRKGEGSRLKAMGFDGYLTKPAHPSEVPQILSLIWDAKQQGRDIPLVTRYTIQEAKAGGREKALFTNTRILLVEDNPINVVVATELLERYGCTVTPAGNGLEALALVKERRFDLIFMDCQMPEMDGFEATVEIRKLEANAAIERVPIIAFTASALVNDQERCLEAGMDDYLSKPVSKDAFEKILTKWVPHKLKTMKPGEEVQQTQIHEQPTEVDTIQIHGQPTEVGTVHPDILDIKAFNALRDIFGDRFTAIVKKYIENTHENINHAEAAIQQGDLNIVQKVAHSLKGICAQFGAIRLTKAAVDMEAFAVAGDLDNSRVQLEELRNAQKQLAEVILQQLWVCAADEMPIVSDLGFDIARNQGQFRGRVLVVDDNVTNQEVAKGMLEKLGVHVDVAADGLEAVQALEDTIYDLVFMDCQMPVWDGLDATRQIRDPQSRVKDHDIPVIALTANASREQCFEAGMNDYISKPVVPTILQQMLERWLPKDHHQAPIQESEVNHDEAIRQSSP